MNRVLIMLSTYNGQKYIREQLDSLYNQKSVDIHILVRDDGSKDSTVEILKEYQRKYGKMTIHADENVGAAKSFHKLILYAKNDFDKFDYYAFCDQDDVWMKHKLSYSVDMLSCSTSRYQLFYSNVIVTNADLRPIRQRASILVDNLQNNIIGNKQLGCTQVFNYELFGKISEGSSQWNRIFKQYYPLHDVWTSLVGFSFKAEIIYGKDPTMYYRQHSSNVVGDNNSSMLRSYRERLNRLFKNPNAKSSKCRSLLLAYKDIPAESVDILKLCAEYREGGLRGKLNLAFNNSFHTQGFVKNIGFIFSVLIGKF